MQKYIFGFVVFIYVFFSLDLRAQNLLDGPEHASYDIANDRYLISSEHTGSIVAIDNAGVQSNFITGLGSVLGNHISGDTLYVINNLQYVSAFDLNSGSILWEQAMFGSLQLDGITADNSGNLYIVDAAPVGKIYKLTISDLSQEVLVPSGLPTYPQDIHYDETNNRLLLASYDTNAPILGIDPDDGMLTSLIITTHGNMDGVAIDNDNYIYVSCNSEGAIYRYEPTFIDPPVKVSTGHSGPAGIGYNPVDNILAIPNYFGDTVDFILLDDTDEDNILDYWDNCPEIPNTDQADADSDNRGDLCDGCPENYNPGGEDIDIDGIEDACDNCPDHPNPGQEDINDNGVGDLCDYICGDIDGTPGINILDIVFLVNNVYKAGPDPDPMESGDVNHDYLVNILDIVLLVNNVYKGGIDPECVVWI